MERRVQFRGNNWPLPHEDGEGSTSHQFWSPSQIQCEQNKRPNLPGLSPEDSLMPGERFGFRNGSMETHRDCLFDQPSPSPLRSKQGQGQGFSKYDFLGLDVTGLTYDVDAMLGVRKHNNTATKDYMQASYPCALDDQSATHSNETFIPSSLLDTKNSTAFRTDSACLNSEDWYTQSAHSFQKNSFGTTADICMSSNSNEHNSDMTRQQSFTNIRALHHVQHHSTNAQISVKEETANSIGRNTCQIQDYTVDLNNVHTKAGIEMKENHLELPCSNRTYCIDQNKVHEKYNSIPLRHQCVTNLELSELNKMQKYSAWNFPGREFSNIPNGKHPESYKQELHKILHMTEVTQNTELAEIKQDGLFHESCKPLSENHCKRGQNAPSVCQKVIFGRDFQSEILNSQMTMGSSSNPRENITRECVSPSLASGKRLSTSEGDTYPVKKAKWEKKEETNGFVRQRNKFENESFMNSVSNLGIQSTVQQILNRITSEMKKKDRNHHDHTKQKLPDCCDNCEKLGFSNSPQCVNKRSADSMDVFDFKDDELEDDKSHLSAIPYRLSKHGLSVSKKSVGINPHLPVTSAAMKLQPQSCITSTVSTGNIVSSTHGQSVNLQNTSQGSTDDISVSLQCKSHSSVTNSHLNSLNFTNREAEKENVFDSSNLKTEPIDPSTEEPILASKTKVDDILHDGLDRIAWIQEHVTNLAEGITEEDEHTERLRKNIRVEIPPCDCRGPGYVPSEEVEGPFYTQLGTAQSVPAVREMMESRTGVSGKALRIEKISYTSKEGRSSNGCPIAKWIIRRSSEEEKYLCVVRQRPGHFCDSACIVVVIVAWEGVPRDTADDLYDYLVKMLPRNGFETERRCGTNEKKTCACQGVDLIRRGASFSFGCSWSMYYNGCKFARSREARKFKLKEMSKEEDLENKLQDLATLMGPLYKEMAPEAHANQTKFEKTAEKCRLGKKEGRPFSGVTACVDFCAHAHRDVHNMQNGSTVVVTLTKHRGLDRPDDEQLHVLPLHVMDMTDEYGNMEAQFDKVRTGALDVLQKYPMEARMRAMPLTPNRKKKGKKCVNPPLKRGRRSKKNITMCSTPPMEKDLKMPTDDLALKNMYFSKDLLDKNEASPGDIKGSNNSLKYDTKAGLLSLSESFLISQKENNGYLSLDIQNVGQEKYCDPNFGLDKCDQKLSQGYSKMASDRTVISSAASSLNTQGQNTDGAINLCHNQLRQSDLDTRQHVTGAPLDLSSSGSDSDLTAFLLTNKMAAGDHPTVKVSPFDLLSNLSTKGKSDFTNNGSLPQSLNKDHNSHVISHDHTFAEALSREHSVNKQKFGGSLEFDTSQGVSPSDLQDLITNRANMADDSPLIDPTVVKCEMEYNENAFHDPEIGGVAIALQHGAVLFEVAKRELHATTGLRNPNRYAPTRISLVFYQHKNLNYYHHGWYEYERKCELLKQKKLEQLKEESVKGISLKEGLKKGKKRQKKEMVDISKTSAAQYKYMWDAPVARGTTLTTDSVITRWIDPQPMVTGPYQRWV